MNRMLKFTLEDLLKFFLIGWKKLDLDVFRDRFGGDIECLYGMRVMVLLMFLMRKMF